MTWLKDSLVNVTPYVKFCSNQPASNDSQYKVYLQFKPILMTTVTYACPWPHMVVVCLIVVLDTRQPIRYRYGDTHATGQQAPHFHCLLASDQLIRRLI